ncbi:MAG: carboxypeptidase regulatory-like domain-containing protein [Planctomycetota bacterium]
MMRHALLAAFLVLVAAAVAWLLWRGDETAGGADPVVPRAEIGSPPPAALSAEAGVAETPTSEPAPTEAAERVEVPFEPPQPAGAGSGRVVGTVRWADDRQPVADVSVRLLGGFGMAEHARALQTRTAADGSFAFAAAPVRWCVVVSALGGEARLSVVADTETHVELLVPRGAAVEGVVVDEAGQPVARAEVWLSSVHGGPDCGDVVARSDARGAFRIESVTARRWIGARARGFVGSAVSLVEGAPSRLELVLVRNDARVRGFVRDARGQRCANAVVVASPPGTPGWRRGTDGTQQRVWAPVSALSDEEGAFLLDGLPPGALSVRAHAPGHGKAATEVDVAAGAVAELVLTLPEPAAVHGRVTADDGAPLQAYLMFGTDTLDRTWASSGEDGVFRAEGLTPGKVAASVVRDGKPALEVELDLAAGEDREWNPVLGRAGSLRGQVVDSRQQPLVGAYVVAFRGSGGLGETVTDARGSFAFANMPREELTLRVGFQPQGSGGRTRTTALVVPGIVPPRDDLVLVVPDDRLPSVRLRARVLRADGMPATGATLWLGGGEDRGLVRAQADARGEIQLQDLMPGSFYVSVHDGEHPTLFLGRRTFAAHDVVDLGDLRLAAGGRIVVTPRPAPGVDIGGLTIEALDAELRSAGTLQAAGSSLRSPVLPAGKVTLVVGGPGIARARHEVVVEAGRELAIDLSLEPGRHRTVRITLPAGAPAPRWVWSTVFGADGREVLGGAGAERDGSGAWTLELWLPARDCSLMVGADGQKLRGQLALPASLPDGAVLDLALQAR